MPRFAFVFDLAGAPPPVYISARNTLAARGWDVAEQGSFYIAPDGHGLVQCFADLHAVVAAQPGFGRRVNSAHLVEFTAQNDVADLLREIAAALP
jgi:hypothetical protein